MKLHKRGRRGRAEEEEKRDPPPLTRAYSGEERGDIKERGMHTRGSSWRRREKAMVHKR